MSNSQTTGGFGIKRIFSLRPYGNQLLTASAAYWTSMVMVLAFFMASSEAISWGYFASFFFNGWYALVSAGVVGTMVFFLVWAVDVSLLTLDRSRPRYEAELYGRPAGSNWKEVTKTGAGIALRLALVIGSLYLTSPYLTQLVFTRDISKVLERQTRTLVTANRKEIEKKYDSPMQDLQKSVDLQRSELTDEIAGRQNSRTKQFGDGPVAKSIKSRIDAQDKALKELTDGRTQELQDFDAAVAGHKHEELGNRWGIVFPEDSVIKRNEIVAEITRLPSFWETSLAIKAFLAFLFFAMLILKIFEPRGVKIYLSEPLQQEWQRYRAGAFDSWLLHHERSRAHISTMTPYRFEDLMVNSYLGIRNADLARIQSSTTEREALEGMQTLHEIENEMPNVVRQRDALQQDLAQLESAISTVVQQQGAFPTTYSAQEAEVTRLQQNLNEIHSLVEGQSRAATTDVETLRSINQVAIRTKAELDTGIRNLTQLQQQKTLYEIQLMPLYEKRKAVLGQISELQAKLDELETAKDEIITRRIASAVLRGTGKAA